METVLIVIFTVIYGLAYLIPPLIAIGAGLYLIRRMEDMDVILKDKRQQIEDSKPSTEQQRRAKLDAEIRAKMDATVRRAQAARRAG